MTTIETVLQGKRDIGIQAIGIDASVKEAVVTMCNAQVGALLVTKEGRYVGILTERDVMVRVVMQDRDPSTTPVDAVMTRKVTCIELDAPAETAMAIMTERRCRHLPVVRDGTVVGMLSIGDLVRWAGRAQQFEIRMLEEYITGKYPG